MNFKAFALNIELMKARLKLVNPKPNEKCLCGSNLKFKKCCSPFLPAKIGDMHNRYVECWKNEDFQGVLRAARADVTKYTICHQSHTVNALGLALEYAPHLFEIDIDALADYVDFLMRAYRQLGRIDEFPAVLERLRNNIIAPRWNQKIIYFHTLCALGESWDVALGRAEIKKLGPITEIHDPEVLAFYLNLIRDELSLNEIVKLIDKIRANSEILSTKIHQGAVKATLLYSHNDFKGAVETLGEVIQQLEEANSEGELTAYQRDKYGQCLYLIGALGIDSEDQRDTETALKFLLRAEAQFKLLMKDKRFNSKGLAQLHRNIADCMRVRDNWECAIQEYKQAYDLDGREIHRVFEAECLYEVGNISDALNVLDAINPSSLGDPESENDYAVRFARISIRENKIERLKTAKALLSQPIKVVPFFSGQRQKILIEVLEAIANHKEVVARRPKKLTLGLAKLSSYFILQPSMFGVGVNFNKIIEDGSKKSTEHKNLESDLN